MVASLLAATVVSVLRNTFSEKRDFNKQQQWLLRQKSQMRNNNNISDYKRSNIKSRRLSSICPNPRHTNPKSKLWKTTFRAKKWRRQIKRDTTLHFVDEIGVNQSMDAVMWNWSVENLRELKRTGFIVIFSIFFEWILIYLCTRLQ